MEVKKEPEKKPPLPQAPAQIIRPLPAKLSFRERIGIRIVILFLILLIFFGLATFWYWFFKIRKPFQPPPLFPQEEVKPPEEEQEKTEILIPASLIATEGTTTIEVPDPKETPDSLSPVLESKLPENQFNRIVIKNLKENKVLSLKDFFDAFQIKSPENLLTQLDNDFTLFIYSSKIGNRLGFVAKIKEGANLTDSLKSWEKTMEKDTEFLFSSLGKDKPALVSYFRNGKYKTAAFRYQTFSRNDLGICYSVIGDYFVFTSSWESITKVIDTL